MNAEMIFLIALFWALLARTLLHAPHRRQMLARSPAEWALDLIGLSIHGVVVPWVQAYVVYRGLSWLAPSGRGSLHLPAWASCLLALVGIDYLYYWNHRLLHTARLWRFHAVHHSGESFDVFTTSRNSAVTTFLILYVWVNGALLYWLADPIPFAVGVAIGNGLDILRHSRLESWPRFAPFTWIISPREHAWHHSSDKYGVNFGGNFNLWDRWHGTHHVSERMPQKLGVALPRREIWKAFWRGHA